MTTRWSVAVSAEFTFLIHFSGPGDIEIPSVVRLEQRLQGVFHFKK